VSNDPASRQQLDHFIAYLSDGRDADYHAAQVEHMTDLFNQFEKDEQ